MRRDSSLPSSSAIGTEGSLTEVSEEIITIARRVAET